MSSLQASGYPGTEWLTNDIRMMEKPEPILDGLAVYHSQLRGTHNQRTLSEPHDHLRHASCRGAQRG